MSEWVYEEIKWLWLPFGWRVIRLKEKFKDRLGHQYKSPILWRRIELSPGYFKQEYIPQTYLKHYKGAEGE